MAMPKQVEQDAKEVEEFEKQLQAPADEDGQTTEVQEPETPPAPVAVEPTKPVEPAVSEDAWEHKYHRLQGKYDAEVPRLHAQVKELVGQVQYLQSQMERAKAAPAPEPNNTASTTVTDEDRELYGDQLIDLQRRIANEVAERYTAKLDAYEAKISTLESRLMQTGSQVNELTFDQRLFRAVPDFEQVNNDPRWVAWLNEFDPVLRDSRRAIAQQAFANEDAEAVAYYVQLFKSTQQTPPKQNNRQAELERQVAPSRGSSGNAPVGQQGKTYTMSQWGAKYDQVATMISKGHLAEAQKLEAELSAAMTQGRVTQ